MAPLTMALLTMAPLTMTLLTMAPLTMAPLTMALLTMYVNRAPRPLAAPRADRAPPPASPNYLRVIQ